MIVLDASALLALRNDEPGAGVVARDAAANDTTISSVNYAEVLQKAARLACRPRPSTPSWTPWASP